MTKEAKAIYDELAGKGFDKRQILAATEDGSCWDGYDVTDEILEEIHAYLRDFAVVVVDGEEVGAVQANHSMTDCEIVEMAGVDSDEYSIDDIEIVRL